MSYTPLIHHRRSIRLKGYDYSQSGMYFITICCQNHICRFGKIENGKMILNDAGQIAFNEWMKTPDVRPNVQLDAFVVMPNHIHGIIVITDIGRDVSHTSSNEIPPTETNVICMGVSHTSRNETHTLSNGVISATGICDGNWGVDGNQGVCDTPLRSPSNTIGAIVRGYKSAVTKQIGYSVWQRNYWEHIIRDEKSYQYIANYIVNNPINWGKDKFHTPHK